MAALAVKAGVELANDKRLRTFAASAIVGLIVILLVPFLALVSIANAKAGYSQEIARIVFDGGGIPDGAHDAADLVGRGVPELDEQVQFMDFLLFSFRKRVGEKGFQ